MMIAIVMVNFAVIEGKMGPRDLLVIHGFFLDASGGCRHGWKLVIAWMGDLEEWP